MLPPENCHDGSDEHADTVAMIGDALKDKFGAGATEVARLQQDQADEDAPGRWDEIVAYLST